MAAIAGTPQPIIVDAPEPEIHYGTNPVVEQPVSSIEIGGPVPGLTPGLTSGFAPVVGASEASIGIGNPVKGVPTVTAAE